MKKIIGTVCIIVLGFWAIVFKYFDNPDLYKNKERVWQSIEEVEYEKELDRIMEKERLLEEHGILVTATVYNPTKDQCDSDPLITADNSKIDLQKLEEGKIQWIAVSRDLRKKFKYGTKVLISGHPNIDGEYEVRDTMNPEWKNRIDILRPVGIDTGKYKVRIVSLEED